MYITTDAAGVLTISLDDVVSIEVEDVEPGDVAASEYSGRRIRFSNNSGEILEVSCAAVGVKPLQLREVKQLAVADRRKVRKRKWFRPRLYEPK